VFVPAHSGSLHALGPGASNSCSRCDMTGRLVCSSYLHLVGASGDVGSRGLFLLHAHTHGQTKKKKLHLWSE
jgi:hypothetical protein